MYKFFLYESSDSCWVFHTINLKNVTMDDNHKMINTRYESTNENDRYREKLIRYTKPLINSSSCRLHKNENNDIKREQFPDSLDVILGDGCRNDLLATFEFLLQLSSSHIL